MQRLLEKQFEISLKIKKRFLFVPYTRTILLKFKEARFIETIEFIEIVKWNWTNIVKRIIKFIKEHTNSKLKKSDIQYIMMYADKIIPTLKETFLEWCFSDNSWDWEWEETPMSSYIAVLSEKLNIDPLRLINEYTVKQLEMMTEGIVWNANCWSKDWQKKNRLFITKQRAKNRPVEEETKIKEILLDLQK